MCRPAVAADFSAAVSLLPQWLDLDPSIVADLPRLWSAFSGAPVHSLAMLDLSAPAPLQLQAWGATIGLPADFAAALDLHGTPSPHLSRRIYQAMHEGRLKPMTDRELAHANARGDLTLFNLNFSMRRTDLGSEYVQGLLAMANDAFRLSHAGMNPDAMFFEGGALDAPYITAAGFRRLPCADDPGWAALPAQRQPMLFGLTREQARGTLPGTSARAVFGHHPPRFRLSATQRKLLWFALFDESDATLTEQLGVSPHGLKKLWRGIYERIIDVEREFFGDPGSDDDGRRGPEKRRQVLAYVRQRPEELQPWAAL